MPSLMDLLNDDTGSSQVKVASGDPIEKMAFDLGLLSGGSVKTASEDMEEKKEHEEEEEEEGHAKKASLSGIEGLYDSLFPDDALGGIKTASQTELTKEAAYEEALGARSHDYFAERLNQRLVKLAYGALAHGTVANHESDHPNHMENNHAERNNGGKAMDLKPHFDNEMVPEHSDTIVGHEEWANGHNTIDNPKGHSMAKKAALRKAQILAALED